MSQITLDELEYEEVIFENMVEVWQHTNSSGIFVNCLCCGLLTNYNNMFERQRKPLCFTCYLSVCEEFPARCEMTRDQA